MFSGAIIVAIIYHKIRLIILGIIDLDTILFFYELMGCKLIFAAVMLKTRKKSSSYTFGFPTSFNPAMIPFIADVIGHLQHIRQEHITKHGES